MEEQIEKLTALAGGYHRYQIIILIVTFFTWSSNSIHITSLPMLEKVPDITYPLKDNTSQIITEPLSYSLCNASNYTVTKNYSFSWIIELGISCSEYQVGLIGSFTYAGMCCGSFLFSVMNKFLTHKSIVILCLSLYIVTLFSMTLVPGLYYKLAALLFLGMNNGLANFSSMSIVSESVSSSKRSVFTSIINIGYSFCPIMYIPIYVLVDNWRLVFYLQNIIAVGCLILIILIMNNSPRMYFSKNQMEDCMYTLRKIAVFNGKIEEFEEGIKSKEFDNILRNDNEGVEKNIETEMKTQFGYSALVKYPSVRYKFLIFSFMFMTISFLTNAVVLNTKTMAGNMYVNIVSLYCVEVVGCISTGFIINFPPIGRKKGLISFYLGIVIGFVLYITFDKLGFPSITTLLSMFLIRFSITGVYTTFYIYIMENYPTPIRSLGFGLNSTFGNIAGIISPIIIEYFPAALLYVIFASLCTCNIIFTLFLKETVGKPMQETIEELNVPDVDKDKLIPGRETETDVEKNTNDKSEKKEEKKEEKEEKNEKKEEKEEKNEKKEEKKEEKEEKNEKKEKEGNVEEGKEPLLNEKED